jgi:ABC-type multidrug transport system fused ATPase/permease subunit
MEAPNPWFAVAISAISAVSTTIVAAYVAVISRRQWQTANEKLRLDLYDRRFEIYLAVLDFYQALVLWEGTEAQIALQLPFLRAYRESMFIFPAKSGVYELLTEFQSHAYNVTQYERFRSIFRSAGMLPIKTSERLDSQKWIVKSIETLEEKMKPFISFDRL